MKKILAMTLIAVLIFLFATNISAASNKYEVAALDLSVSIPSYYTVITQNTSENDPVFDHLGVSASDLLSYFRTNGIYLNAVNNIVNDEIVVTMTENILDDFNLLSDATISALTTSLINEYTNYGISVTKHEIYQHSQAKFIKLYFVDSAQTVSALQYYTIYNGKAMNFTMRSYTGTLSYTQEQAIKTVVDSIRFNTAPQKQEVFSPTPSFTYTDPETKVKFTVPTNWTQKALSKDREYIDVKFVSSEEEGMSILYGSTDIWSKMSAADRAGGERADINNSMFTNADIAEMTGASISKVKQVTYNDVNYFQAESISTSDVYGYDITIAVTHAIYIDNGWMYWFQFSGNSSNEFFSDFKTMLNTVTFPQTASNHIDCDDARDFDVGVWVAIIVMLMLFAFCVMVIVIKRKQPKEEEYLSEEAKVETTLKYCHHCGSQLFADSDFCHNCGTKTVKEEDKN